LTALNGVALALGTIAIAAGWVASSPAGEPESKATDAAEAVGEGNASRWLDFYRRERGQNWEGAPSLQNVRDPLPAKAPDPASRSAPNVSAEPPERR
jgi:hypothetical protein